MRIRQSVLAWMLAATGLVGGSLAAEAASLTVTPASGVYAATQHVDIVVILEGLAGLGVVGGQALFDRADVTALVAGCLRPEPLADALSFRCPGIPLAALGLGTHVFQMTLQLSDGSQLRGGAIWQILRVGP